jgi:hypothetical protein
MGDLFSKGCAVEGNFTFHRFGCKPLHVFLFQEAMHCPFFISAKVLPQPLVSG